MSLNNIVDTSGPKHAAFFYGQPLSPSPAPLPNSFCGSALLLLTSLRHLGKMKCRVSK